MMSPAPTAGSANRALLDPLTGIYSRLTLQKRFQEEVNRSKRYDEPLAVLMLDLDHFKSINDAFGHTRGDAVLLEFVARLKSLIREADILFRYGGDEFVALLPKTTLQQASALAERLLTAICSAPFRGDPPLNLSLSIGVSSYPEDGDTPQVLFEKADQRTYLAKRKGRGRVVSMDEPVDEILAFDSLTRMIERDQPMAVAARLLERMQVEKRGVLQITGPAGSGRSRFLAEVGKAARLQGYEVLTVHCRPALRGRAYGALLNACQDADLPLPGSGMARLDTQLEVIVRERGRSGLVILADDLQYADWSTIEMFYRLLNTPLLPVVMLSYTVEAARDHRLSVLAEFSPRAVAELYPLSVQGTGVWLRSVMGWEAPREFLDWLYGETDGLPAAVQAVLLHLVQRGILTRQPEGWALLPDYADLSLRDWLTRNRIAPVLNLPLTLTPFVGRDEEVQKAIALLGGASLLTIVGLGGVGKTRLAIQVATEAAENFPHGVHFVPLAALESVDLLEAAVADALGFQFYAGEDARAQLLNYLRNKRLLLILDNFEHLTAGSGLVVDLLTTAPEVKVLVTSREQLRLRGETVFELRGMDFPDSAEMADIEDYAAVQLFLHLAHKFSPGFMLTDAQKPHVVRICQKVDGLPLGIELAAAWVPVISCRDIADEIESSLELLGGTLSDVPDRHRGIRAVFESSWSLLAADEQKALARLSVFRGGFQKEAARQVCGTSLASIIGLVQKSLLRSSQVDPLQSTRFEIHEVLQPFANEKLKQAGSGEYTAVCQAHSEFYTALLTRLGERMEGVEQKQALTEVSREVENIRSAWFWGVENGRLDGIERSLHALFTYFQMRTLVEDAVEFFETVGVRLRSLAAAQPDQAERVEWICARISARLLAFYQRSARYEQGRACYESARQILQQAEDRREYALLVVRMGSFYVELRQHSEAHSLLQESLALSRDAEDEPGIINALNELGVVAYHQGEYQQSEGLLQEALERTRRLANGWRMGRTLINLGNVECDLGKYDAARAYYLESLELCRELGDRSGMAVVLNNLGDVERVVGGSAQAEAHLEASAQICHEIGDRLGQAIALDNLGELAYQQGDYEKAEGFLKHSLALLDEIHVHPEVISLNYYLGLIAQAKGDHDGSKAKLLLALRFAVESQSPPFVLQALGALVLVLFAQQQDELAYEVLAVVLQHPGGMDETRNLARQILAARGETVPEAVLHRCETLGCEEMYADVLRKVLESGDNIAPETPPNAGTGPG